MATEEVIELENVELPVYEEYSIADIYRDISLNGELIITIDVVEEIRLRRTLSVLKAKESAKLKENGLQPDDAKLEFIIIPDPKVPKGLRKLHIVLKGSRKVKLYERIIPTDDLM